MSASTEADEILALFEQELADLKAQIPENKELADKDKWPSLHYTRKGINAARDDMRRVIDAKIASFKGDK